MSEDKIFKITLILGMAYTLARKFESQLNIDEVSILGTIQTTIAEIYYPKEDKNQPITRGQ